MKRTAEALKTRASGNTRSAEPQEPRIPQRQGQRQRDRDRDRAGAFLRLHEAAAGPGRSKHRKRSNIPLARSAKAPSSPELPCARRTDLAEPLRGTHPQRQPRHFATTEQVRAPGSMRRSFRTHRLCGIRGVSPRAGMRCPVGALRTPHQHRAFLRSPRKYAQQSGNGPELPQRAKARSRGALTVHPAPAPAPALGHRRTGESPRVHAAFLQNAPVVCPTRGFTPGWYAVPRWGTPNASPPQSPHRLRVPTSPAPSPQHTGSTTIVFPQWRQPNHPIKGHTSNPRSGSGIGPERA